jgi:hypothetical protein
MGSKEMTLELPPSFIHDAPEGYTYTVKTFKRGMLSIWLLHHRRYSYNSDQVSTIWGFYAPKTQQYHAPINSTQVGKIVDINDTRPYTAMKLKLNPLMAAFG